MAPFTISTHHSLLCQGCLPQETRFTKSKMSPDLPSSKPESTEDLPLVHYCKTSIMKLKVHLLQILRRVVSCCTKVTKLLCSKTFFFVCVVKSMAMMGTMRRSGVEGLERLGVGDGLGEKDPEMKVWMECEDEDDEWESSVFESDEEEDDEDSQSERESDEETDEDEKENDEDEEDDDKEEDDDEEEEACKPEDVDSDWSDEEDGSEASAESLELWESFLNNSDPYNPLSFCSNTSSRANTEWKQLNDTRHTAETTADSRPEETHPEPSSAQDGKKVRFSDQVTVRPLVAWGFASRAARDGSCWLQMARDRERFRRRAEKVEVLLKPCLTAQHRAAVWDTLQH